MYFFTRNIISLDVRYIFSAAHIRPLGKTESSLGQVIFTKSDNLPKIHNKWVNRLCNLPEFIFYLHVRRSETWYGASFINSEPAQKFCVRNNMLPKSNLACGHSCSSLHAFCQGNIFHYSLAFQQKYLLCSQLFRTRKREFISKTETTRLSQLLILNEYWSWRQPIEIARNVDDFTFIGFTSYE